MNDGPKRVYHAGESFYELPGAHHAVSRNASATEPAKLLAVFAVDTDDKALTTPDKSAQISPGVWPATFAKASASLSIVAGM